MLVAALPLVASNSAVNSRATAVVEHRSQAVSEHRLKRQAVHDQDPSSMFAGECLVAVVSAVSTPDGRSVARSQSRSARSPSAGFGLPGLFEGQPARRNSERLFGNCTVLFRCNFWKRLRYFVVSNRFGIEVYHPVRCCGSRIDSNNERISPCARMDRSIERHGRRLVRKQQDLDVGCSDSGFRRRFS